MAVQPGDGLVSLQLPNGVLCSGGDGEGLCLVHLIPGLSAVRGSLHASAEPHVHALTRRGGHDWGTTFGPDGMKSNERTSYGSSHKVDHSKDGTRKITTEHRDHSGNHLVTVTHNYKDGKHTDSSVEHPGGSQHYLPESEADRVAGEKIGAR
jgi:hypothetical protein